MEKYISALLREAQQKSSFLTEPLETVYIGGGTPSLLPPELLEYLLISLSGIYDFKAVREFSVEANPGSVTGEWLETAIRYGVHRISFGVQASQPKLLNTLGRIHSFDDAVQSVSLARNCGFQNINLDLIFGIPGQTLDDWRETLKKTIALNPEHISAYGLIPEKGTPIDSDLRSGRLSLPDPDLERRMYDEVIRMLEDSGLQQYEISNFARPGFQCIHNIGYWDQSPYIGLGISAASMVRRVPADNECFSVRWTNPSSFHDYYDLIEHPYNADHKREIISPEDARFETVMLSLRMTSGMRRSRFRELHGDVPERWYAPVLYRLKDHGLMEMKDDSWRLTRRGMDIQNSILLEFMD